jgi:hypothetical protein
MSLFSLAKHHEGHPAASEVRVPLAAAIPVFVVLSLAGWAIVVLIAMAVWKAI